MAVCCGISLIHVRRTFVLHEERDWDTYGTYASHSYLLAPLCGTLPLRDELSWHFINFIHSCLSSDSEWYCSLCCASWCVLSFYICYHVAYVANKLLHRMLSPIGRNAQYCCSHYNANLASFSLLNKSSIWHHVRNVVSADVWNRVVCILELLFIRCHFYTLELLLTFSEIDSIISFMCTVRSSFEFDCVFIIFFFLCVPCVRSLW